MKSHKKMKNTTGKGDKPKVVELNELFSYPPVTPRDHFLDAGL